MGCVVKVDERAFHQLIDERRVSPDAVIRVFRHSFLVIWTDRFWVPGKVPR